MVSGPIILVEDDQDDKYIIEEVLKELAIPNRLISFTRRNDAFDYLKNTAEQPFVIFSDINLPGVSGLDFKWRIDSSPELRKKSIPFVFFSTSADKETINKVYTEMTVQGYFQKTGDYGETKNIVRAILEYWKVCKHPNSR